MSHGEVEGLKSTKKVSRCIWRATAYNITRLLFQDFHFWDTSCDIIIFPTQDLHVVLVFQITDPRSNISLLFQRGSSSSKCWQRVSQWSEWSLKSNSIYILLPLAQKSLSLRWQMGHSTKTLDALINWSGQN